MLRRGVLDEVPTLAQLAGISVLITLLVSDSFWGSSLGPRHTALLWLLIATGTALTRMAVRMVLRRALPPERCLVLGSHAMADSLGQRLNSSSTLNAEVVLRLPLLLDRSSDPEGRNLVDGGLDQFLQEHRIERVIVAPDAGDADDEVLDAIRRLESAGVRISVAPRMLEVVGASMALDDVDGIALLGVPPTRSAAGPRS